MESVRSVISSTSSRIHKVRDYLHARPSEDASLLSLNRVLIDISSKSRFTLCVETCSSVAYLTTSLHGLLEGESVGSKVVLCCVLSNRRYT